MVQHAESFRKGIEADVQFGKADGKFIGHRHFEWEAYGSAALLALERDANDVDRAVAHIEKAVQVIRTDKQWTGLQFISTIMYVLLASARLSLTNA
jgi:phosphate/sulfate permease